MQNKLSRRTLVTGAAWAAPVVMATSAVPAFATSPVEPCVADKTFNSQHYAKPPRGNTREKVYDHWTVPADVHQIKFYVRGAAGGSTHEDQYGGGYGGAGAEVSGYLDVTPGETLTFVTGASGTANLDGSPAPGGQGFGDGGSSAALPNDAAVGIRNGQDQYINNAGLSAAKVQYGGSGGGASAIVRMEDDGYTIKEVIAIAGGGGGAGITVQHNTNDYPRTKEGSYKTATLDIGEQGSGGMQVQQSPQEVGGQTVTVVNSVDSMDGGDAYTSLENYPDYQQTVYGGKGSGTATEGSDGTGGAGGDAPFADQDRVTQQYLSYARFDNPTGSYIYYSEDGNIYASAFAGAQGNSTSNPAEPVNGADGVSAWGAVETYSGHYADGYNNANYYVYAVSGAGGGGYGGGGSGSAIGQGVRVTAPDQEQDIEGSSNKFRYSGAFASVGAGGAGGSYLAPGIENYDGKKFWAHNNRTFGTDDTNGHGRIKVIWCDPRGSFKDYPDDPGVPAPVVPSH
ncbi:MAG: glycine-rich protein [Rothia sp. (in: high G+C Gram-positive bacteria)]|uniref:glycine-rich protein n=1 Tax=Rothia sp. (in: high G+C Gram-positive bacteria) TaxID=1885016 RepID=UPI0026DBB53A|nr:glycine-rich protein [Rothia sp. (in: high G+C Gram-positive bacteria)]MDO4883598.1 glycine-rich protein [Rothia sp. (in: high G+C Gram-positive bacteria)]